MTKEQLLAAIAAPGLYVVARRELIVIETDADGVQHELKPASLRRDGVLAPDGWSDREDLIVVGPFDRLVPEPIDVVLHCPKCGLQHIDRDESPSDREWAAQSAGDRERQYWSNPPHRTHMCYGCGHKWRPADVPTNGVAAVKTKGKADSPFASVTIASETHADAQKLRAALLEVGGWEHRGDSIAEVWDENHGNGAWAALFEGARSTAAQPAGVTLSALVSKWRHAAEHLGLEGLASLSDCADELETAMAHSAAAQPVEPIPEVLFDSFAVLTAMSKQAKARTSPENVCDVLDAVVDLLRAAPPAASGDSTPPSAQPHPKFGYSDTSNFDSSSTAGDAHKNREILAERAQFPGDPSGALRPEPEAAGHGSVEGDVRALRQMVADCEVYLKEGETPAQRIDRERRDTEAVLNLLIREKQRTEAMREVMLRMMAGIDHLAEIARQWEPDYSSGADRRGWVLAKDARDDAARLIAETPQAASGSSQGARSDVLSIDVVEQRLLTWRQRFMNKSGDRLALDDFMGQESIDDLIDFVCSPPAQSAEQGATPPAPAALVGDGEQLWLWQNGDHFLAFRHLYPCYSPGGDPMTLGEPFGRAIFKHSHNREGKPNEQQRTDRQSPRSGADLDLQRRRAPSAGQACSAGAGASIGYGQHPIAPQGGWGAGDDSARQQSVPDIAGAAGVLAAGRNVAQGVAVQGDPSGALRPEPEAVGREHELKTDPAVFQAVLDGTKTYEIRLNDRGFAVGDTLRLLETTHTGAEIAAGAALAFTGREVTRRVSHMLTGPIYGLAAGWSILSLAPPQASGERGD